MDICYQLSPVNFPSESSPLPSPDIELTLFGYVSGSNQRLYPLYHVSSRKHGTVDKGVGEEQEQSTAEIQSVLLTRLFLKL